MSRPARGVLLVVLEGDVVLNAPLLPALNAHLRHALANEATWARQQGVALPPELSALLQALAAMGRQDPPLPPPPGPDPDAVAVTIRQAAHRLGLSSRTIERRVSDGTLASALVGGRRLIPVGALAALVSATS